VTPAQPVGAVSVQVTNPDGQSAASPATFTYVVPITVTGVAPNNGSANGGTAVTITGTNFVSGATVMFGGVAATSVSVVSATQITATTPAHSAGAVDVQITNPTGQAAVAASAFTYNVSFSTSGNPTITAITPNNGSTIGGTAITITGSNFQTGAAVTVGG